MVHWGILGAGKIAGRFAESLVNEPRSILSAIAARKEEKALSFIEKHSADRYYLSYDELLEDGTIDAIYLSLPHALHKEWAIKALCHKKAVLCEKPATLSSRDMLDIKTAAIDNNTLFMEAMKSRFVPLYGEVIRLIDEGKIGTLQSIDSSLCIKANTEKATYHFQKGQGGALYDSGIYCASWIQSFAEGDAILTDIRTVFKDGVDIHVDATLKFRNLYAHLETAFDEMRDKNTILQGDEGRIIIYDHHRPQRALLQTDYIETLIEKPYIYDDFYTEISHFVDLIEKGETQSPVMSLNDSVSCAAILDTIRHAFY